MTAISEVPAHKPLRMWHARKEDTTRILVQRAESYLLFAQAIWIFVTSFLDKVAPDGQHILWGIAALHVFGAIAAYYYGGPFFNGGAWMWVWVGATLLIPLVMAGIVPIGEYGASTACFQLCGYPVAPIVFLAFYPWLGVTYDYLRPAASAFVVVLIAAMPLAIMVAINGDLTPTNWGGWANGASGYLLAYLGGLMFGAITRDAANEQVGAQQEAYTEIFRTLHDNVHTTLDAVIWHYRHGEEQIVGSKLKGLAAIVNAERTRLTLADNEVSLPHMISRHIEQVSDVIDSIETRQMGSIYVSQQLGIFLNRAVGALFRNVIAQSAVTTRLKVDARVVDDDIVVVEVCDNGPGFDDKILDDSSKSLHDLREQARALGGDLVKSRSTEFETRIEIWVPLHEDD